MVWSYQMDSIGISFISMLFYDGFSKVSLFQFSSPKLLSSHLFEDFNITVQQSHRCFFYIVIDIVNRARLGSCQ